MPIFTASSLPHAAMATWVIAVFGDAPCQILTRFNPALSAFIEALRL
jgi:hypothetical protein